MSIAHNFPGHGMRADSTMQDAGYKHIMTLDEIADAEQTQRIFSGPPEPDDMMSEALAEDLAKELPTATLIDGSRWAYERQIAAHREEKAKQQRISSTALAKARQLTTSIRSLEDALDSLLASEA